MRIAAPAKVNLSLRILGRRPDGFHEIDSIMTTISLCDGIVIVETGDGDGGLDLTCDDPSVPCDGRNLVARAVRAFRQATGDRRGLRVHLEKRIPHGAGLGGGSSDAAATLLGLDRLAGSGLGPAGLHGMAASLGSDVPFFLHGGLVRCTGRGEMVEPLAADPPDWPLLLLKPPFGVRTPWAYGAYASGQRVSRVPPPGRVDAIDLVNDIEASVFLKYVPLAEMRHWLGTREGARAALLSGSGSCVFAVLEGEGAAEHLGRMAAARYGNSLWQTVARPERPPPIPGRSTP